MVQLVLKQTLIMFSYMLVGFIMFKAKLLDRNGTRSLANLVIYFIFPIMVIRSFKREFSLQVFGEFGLGLLFCVLGMLISILLSNLTFRHKSPVENLASTFPNAGFFGIPLITAVLGESAVIYSIGSSFLSGALQHTYGVGKLTGERGRFTVKSFLLAPNCISLILGLILFTSGAGAKLPPMLNDFIDGVAATNTPVVMIILGSYLAQSDLKKLFITPRLYLVSFIRLTAVPFVLMGLLYPINVNPIIKLAVVICMATPTAANVPVYSQIHGHDYPYACQAVALTTILSIFSLPFISFVAQKVFGA